MFLDEARIAARLNHPNVIEILDLGAEGDSYFIAMEYIHGEDLRRITAFGGTAAVNGQGIVMEVNGDLDAIALNDLVNELRNAGAEAIAVDQVRITAGSVAIQGPRSLEVDGVEVGRRFTLRAIGSPDGLLSAMQRPGGIISQLKLFVSATIQIQQVESVTLPATTLSLLPVVGKPIQ